MRAALERSCERQRMRNHPSRNQLGSLVEQEYTRAVGEIITMGDETHSGPAAKIAR